jgi:hypothetical protein
MPLPLVVLAVICMAQSAWTVSGVLGGFNYHTVCATVFELMKMSMPEPGSKCMWLLCCPALLCCCCFVVHQAAVFGWLNLDVLGCSPANPLWFCPYSLTGPLLFLDLKGATTMASLQVGWSMMLLSAVCDTTQPAHADTTMLRVQPKVPSVLLVPNRQGAVVLTCVPVLVCCFCPRSSLHSRRPFLGYNRPRSSGSHQVR